MSLPEVRRAGRCADKMQRYKYVVHQVAYGETATLMVIRI
jgi:hypothetical protein